VNLRYLRTFLVVSQSPTLTEAAQRLGLTQSAVSLQLQKLEREFGAQLVDRVHHPAVLTPAGEALARDGARILAAYDRALDEVQRVSGEVVGTLVLAASTIPGEYLVPRLLADFVGAHPGARAETLVADTAGVYEALTERRAVFGFTGARRDDLGLTHEALFHDEVVLVGRAGRYPSAVGLGELVSLPFIAREPGSGTSTAVADVLRAAGVDPDGLRSTLVLGSTQAVLSAVRAGAGVGFLSQVAAADALALGAVQEVRVEGLQFLRTLWLAYDQARVAGALRQTFLAHALSWAAAESAR
jgi:DNA-binding transcriptional LysR family regulator